MMNGKKKRNYNNHRNRGGGGSAARRQQNQKQAQVLGKKVGTAVTSIPSTSSSSAAAGSRNNNIGTTKKPVGVNANTPKKLPKGTLVLRNGKLVPVDSSPKQSASAKRGNNAKRHNPVPLQAPYVFGVDAAPPPLPAGGARAGARTPPLSAGNYVPPPSAMPMPPPPPGAFLKAGKWTKTPPKAAKGRTHHQPGYMSPADMPPPPLPPGRNVFTARSPASNPAAPQAKLHYTSKPFIPSSAQQGAGASAGAGSSSAPKMLGQLIRRLSESEVARRRAPSIESQSSSYYGSLDGEGYDYDDEEGEIKAGENMRRRLSSWGTKMLVHAHSFCEEDDVGNTGAVPSTSASAPRLRRNVSFAADVEDSSRRKELKTKQLSRTRSEIRRIFEKSLEESKVRKQSSGDESATNEASDKFNSLSLNTKEPKSRFNTKWATPSRQKIIFNYTAKNIPKTPGSTRGNLRKKLVQRADSSGVSSGDSTDDGDSASKKRRHLIPRRQSSFKRERETMSESSLKRLIRRQTSGGTAMFPADRYDAVYR